MQNSLPSSNPERTTSYKNLDIARQKARETSGYDSVRTRTRVQDIFRQRFGSDAHPWQVDVAESMLVGLDSVVIAGTGAGKTIPFMMPLMLDPANKVIVISPLKVLQEDQVSRFVKMKITATAVNGNTWSLSLQKELENNQYQGIFALPEMCLKHAAFCRILTDSNFSGVCAVIVDEAHCISQWGGDFRSAYSELGKLGAFFPPHIPIHATTATATPTTIRDIRSTLGIHSLSSFTLNLGNDRPNVSFHVHNIKSATDYDSLRSHLFSTPNVSTSENLIKTIVFVNAIMPTHVITRTVRSWLPHRLRKYVDYIHSLRSPQAKRP